MLFAKAALALTALATPILATGHTEYYAELGKYGTFELEISADEGTMTWKSDLANIDELATELNITGGIQQLNYHLHSYWTWTELDFAIGGTDCDSLHTGGHYDPFFACGPASGVPNATCTAIGRPRGVPGIYKCSPARYAAGEFADCEVGDLSGKDGPLVIDGDGNASRESAFPDPLAALNAQYVDAAVSAPFDKWGSIVFHNGSPRVLCAKIFKREQRLCQVEFVLYNADTDEPVGPLKAQETIMPNKFNIVARPNADCDPTRSAKLNLAGPIRVKNRVDRREPATVFGDKRGNILGRDYKPGNYTVSAEFYSMGNLRGELVVSGEFEFEIIPKLADAFGTWYIDETPNYEQTCDNVCSENGNLVCNAETAHALVDTVEKLTYVYEVELGLTPQMGYGASFPNDPISDLNPRVDYFNQQITFSSVPEDGQSICNGLFENTQQRICCCGPTAGMVCRVAPP